MRKLSSPISDLKLQMAVSDNLPITSALALFKILDSCAPSPSHSNSTIRPSTFTNAFFTADHKSAGDVSEGLAGLALGVDLRARLAEAHHVAAHVFLRKLTHRISTPLGLQVGVQPKHVSGIPPSLIRARAVVIADS